jgi:hypothetical protein
MRVSWSTSSGVSRSNTCRRTSTTCPGAICSTDARPAEVSRVSWPRRSVAAGQRVTQPRSSSAVTACDSRLGEMAVS